MQRSEVMKSFGTWAAAQRRRRERQDEDRESLSLRIMALPSLEESAVEPVPQQVEDHLGLAFVALVQRYPERRR